MILNPVDIFNASILIVNDQRATVQWLEETLIEAGHSHITSTLEPHTACGLHLKKRYDLILLDLDMASTDGLALIEQLRAIEPDAYLPVLALTAQPEQRLRALQVGAKDVVGKPTDAVELQLRVRNMLEVRLLHKKMAHHSKQLEHKVIERTRDLNHEIIKLTGSEQAILQSEQRHAALFTGAPVPMWVLDPATLRFLASNDAASAGYGYARDEFLRMDFFDLLPATEHARLRQHMAGSHPDAAGHWSCRRKDGSALNIQAFFQPILYEGREARCLWALQRAPRRKHPPAAATLAAQDSLFWTLAEEAPQVIWYADARGRLIHANRQWYELVGGVPADWLGGQWFKAVHPQDHEALQANWQHACRTREPYTGVRRILSRHGACHTMSYKATPVLDANGDVAFWIGVDADISEVTAMEAALRRSNEDLVAFSYSVSHDLRSPLNTIDGFSRLLVKHLGAPAPNGEKTQHYLGRIQAGVAQMGRLIEDLLSLAQVSRTEFRHETVNLSELAAQVLEQHQGYASEREVQVSIAPDLRARGDARLIWVVLENLLGNAWKFTSLVPCAEIAIGQLSDADGKPVFFVRDNGAGFDMAYADKLFTTFQRLHAVTDFPGTGVGLATVRRIVTRHGGEVWADSEPGKGATFFFTLPDSGP
jgi:PAS domain S-box-containing protein